MVAQLNMENEIYFARHVHEWNPEGLSGSFIEFMYRNKAVGIHFKGIESWNPDDYVGLKNQGPSAIEYMNRCNTGDAERYIFASYKIGREHKVLMGRPKAGSKCFLREHLGVSTATPIKLLFLEDDAIALQRSQFPFAYLLAPKQSTFVRWYQCEKVANAFIHNTPYDLLDPDFYLPWALEIICEEYLRRKGLLEYKLYKSGGNLKDLDIVGLTRDGNRVLAQVKYKSNRDQFDSFLRLCQEFGNGDFYFFFGNRLDVPISNNVRCIQLADVLSEFKDAKDYLQRLITTSM